MSALTRGIVGLGAIGGVCGGGYGLHKLLSNDSIGSKLEANKYVLLTKEQVHEKHWDEILKSYEATIKADNNSKFKFENFVVNDPQPNQSDKVKLQKHCEDTLKKRTFEDDADKTNYKKAERWCVVPSTVSEKLTSEKFEVLDTTIKEGTKNKHDEEWEKKIKDYVKKENKNKISNWSDDTLAKAEKAEKEKLMQKCKELQDTKTHQLNYETIFEDAKRWCAMPKQSNS